MRFPLPLLLILIVPVLEAQSTMSFADLDEVTAIALLKDTALASAAAKLSAARAGLGAEKSWRSSSLTLQSSWGAPTGESVEKALSGTYGASVAVPLSHWLSLGAAVSATEGKSEGEVPEGRVSVSLRPLSLPSEGADLSYRIALNSYNAVLRAAILETRSAIRSLAVVRAELAYNEAELELARSGFEAARIKSERGELGASELLGATAELIAAEVSVDALLSEEAALRDDLALRLGIPTELLPETTALAALDKTGTLSGDPGALLDREGWLAASTNYIQALLDAEGAEADSRRAQVRPDLVLSGEAAAALSGSNRGLGSWTVSASLKLPVDILYRDASSAASELAAAKARAAELARAAALNDFERKTRELARCQTTWRRSETSAAAARLVLEQAVLLRSLDRRSESELLRARADTLKAEWQTAVALKSYKDALDALSRF